MLHYLVPDEVAAGSLEPNLDFYEPRTAHGSSLSPGVHAALLARAGRLDEALEMLRLTARIDLDDVGHMTAGGLHLAAMGSVWQTLAFGFAGLRPVGDALAIDPVLAPGWDTLELRVRFRDSRVRVRVLPGAVEASADPPVSALNPAGERVQLDRTPQTFSSPHRPRGGTRDDRARRARLRCLRATGAQHRDRPRRPVRRDRHVACTYARTRSGRSGGRARRRRRAARGQRRRDRADRERRARSDVAALVLGARGVHGGPQPAGHTALEVITRIPKPVAVVPPHGHPPEQIARILVPLEGSSESSHALEETIKLAHRRRLEILVLHVHSPATVPAFSDHEPHATLAWEQEFLTRYIATPHDRVTLLRRLGVPADDVVAVAHDAGADLIVLAWSQDLAPGRARVVSETLAHSEIPVLLLPVQ